jgi:hypothetical protein
MLTQSLRMRSDRIKFLLLSFGSFLSFWTLAPLAAATLAGAALAGAALSVFGLTYAVKKQGCGEFRQGCGVIL